MLPFKFLKDNRLAVLIFFVFAGVFLVSCAPSQKKAVATIDGKTISADFFFTTTSNRFDQKSLDGREKELEDFYHTVLRAYDAKQHGLNNEETLKYKIYVDQRQIKVQQLYQAFVVDEVITEEMIKEAYNNMDERRTIRHILITDSTSTRAKSARSPEEAKDLAREVKQKIASGEISFTEAVEEYSEGPSKGKGGDLGTISWGQMVQPFQVAAWKLKPNTLSDPVRTQYGVHLIEVTAVDTTDLGTFEEARDRIVRSLQRSKRNDIRNRTQKALDQIKEETGFSMDQKAIESVSRKLYNQYKEEPDADLAELANDIDNYEPVGTLGGNQVTLGDLKNLLHYIQNFQFRGVPSETYLVRRISGELQQENLLMFAEDYNISEYKDTDYKLRWTEDQILNKYYVNNIVLKDFPPSEDSLRAYFDRVKFEKYSNPANVHVREIYFTDKQTAENVRQKLDAGEDFGTLAAKHTRRESAKESRGDLGWFESNRYGPIGQKALTLEKGDVKGPFPVGTGWSIIKLIDREAGETQSFEDIRKQVRQDYTDYYRPRRLEENILKLEQKYNSELYYSSLKNM